MYIDVIFKQKFNFEFILLKSIEDDSLKINKKKIFQGRENYCNVGICVQTIIITSNKGEFLSFENVFLH